VDPKRAVFFRLGDKQFEDLVSVSSQGLSNNATVSRCILKVERFLARKEISGIYYH